MEVRVLNFELHAWLRLFCYDYLSCYNVCNPQPRRPPERQFRTAREDGFAVEAFCVDVDAMDYDPLEQIDVNHAVRYFTFYSLDFSLLQTLYQ